MNYVEDLDLADPSPPCCTPLVFTGKTWTGAEARTLWNRQTMRPVTSGLRGGRYEIRNAILASRNSPRCGKNNQSVWMAPDAHSNISSRKMSTLRPRY